MRVHFSSKIPSIQMRPKLHIPPQVVNITSITSRHKEL
jgi:hypothetical protein